MKQRDGLKSKLKFPEGMNFEIEARQKDSDFFQFVGVDNEGVITETNKRLKIPLTKSLAFYSFEVQDGAENEAYYLISRVGGTEFYAERYRWRLNKRSAYDFHGEDEIEIFSEDFQYRAGKWTAAEFSRFIFYKPGLNEIRVSFALETINNFLQAVREDRKHLLQTT